jgi:hypothetical protein
MLSFFPLLHAPNSLPYLLQFPASFYLCFTASLSLAEGQAGTAWKPSEQQIFLLPPHYNNKCSVTHYTPFVFPSLTFHILP